MASRVASPARAPARALDRRAVGRVHRGARAGATRAAIATDAANKTPGRGLHQHSVVMKFGGSSVADAARVREVAQIVLSFPEEMPVLVLSAMGKTTNNLLAAGEMAMRAEEGVEALEPLRAIRRLHEDTMEALGTDAVTKAEVQKLLKKLEQVCTGIALMQEVTSRTRALLVSFGERMSTRIFASYLRSLGARTEQVDTIDDMFVTTDEFENGMILDATFSKTKARLTLGPGDEPVVRVVTGFLGRGEKTGAVCTLGRGGSDLTATVIGKALGLKEVQVWKDVDGVLSADPREVEGTVPMPFLSFQEATELAYFGAQVLHPHSMRPAMDSSDLCVRVKNSYNIRAPGTVIGHVRDEDEHKNWLLTSIVQKKNVTMLDITSTRMLGQYGFLAKVFSVMASNGISVDVVATSEVSVSLTLDPSKLWSRDLAKEELEKLVQDFENEGIAHVTVSSGHSIISLIGNVERNNEIMERSFRALGSEDIKVKMVSQGASKTNISLLVDQEQGSDAVRAIHSEFFSK
jgi:aspartate kinase